MVVLANQSQQLNIKAPFYLSTLLKFRSSYNRSIKLFFVGNEGRGKSTLMRGLRNISMESEEANSLGVKYGVWVYPSTRNSRNSMDPVTFITCDCAGEVSFSSLITVSLFHLSSTGGESRVLLLKAISLSGYF